MSDDMQRFESQEPASREEVLLLAEEMMRECHTKIMNGRIRDPEKDRARQGYFNSFSSLMNAYRH